MKSRSLFALLSLLPLLLAGGVISSASGNYHATLSDPGIDVQSYARVEIGGTNQWTSGLIALDDSNNVAFGGYQYTNAYGDGNYTVYTWINGNANQMQKIPLSANGGSGSYSYYHVGVLGMASDGDICGEVDVQRAGIGFSTKAGTIYGHEIMPPFPLSPGNQSTNVYFIGFSFRPHYHHANNYIGYGISGLYLSSSNNPNGKLVSRDGCVVSSSGSTTIFSTNVLASEVSGNAKVVFSSFSAVALNANGWIIGSEDGVGKLLNGNSVTILPGIPVALNDNNDLLCANNSGGIFRDGSGVSTAITSMIPSNALASASLSNITPISLSNRAPTNGTSVTPILNILFSATVQRSTTNSGPGTFLLRKFSDGSTDIHEAPALADTNLTSLTPPNNQGIVAALGDPNTTGYQHAFLMVPVELAVDANRDGTIVMASDPRNSANVDANGNFLPVDSTSQDRPFRFWGNNDTTRTSQTTIDTPTNLENFSRLAIRLNNLLAQSVQNGTFQIGLKWKQIDSGSPAIQVYSCADTNGSLNYLTSSTTAASQIAATYNSSLGSASGSNVVTLPKGNLSTGNNYFLFEAKGIGKGKLEMVILDQNGNQIGEGGSLWLNLVDIKTMYQRAVATGAGSGQNPPAFPYLTGGQFNDSSLGTTVETSKPFVQPSDESKQCTIFVHGWNTDYNGYINNSETMFKRLWWQGYKGRFIGYRWPSQTSLTSFNSSEWLAWLYGRPFMNYVNGIKGRFSIMSVVAHSQGNVVVASAIQEGLSFDNYLMLQAAIPTGCYTTANQYNNYSLFAAAEQSSPTPDNYQAGGYRGFLTPEMGNVRRYYNYYNPQDFALSTGNYLWGLVAANWEINERDYKPDTPNGYHYNYISFYGYFIGVSSTIYPNHNVIDIHESVSFVARPRSQAAGADPNSASVFGGATDLSRSPYSFGRDLSDHSGEFTRPLQQVWSLYKNFENVISP